MCRGAALSKAAQAAETWFQGQAQTAAVQRHHLLDPALAERATNILGDLAAPTRRQEPWRFTDLEALLYSSIASPSPPTAAGQDVSAAVSLLLENNDCARLVFVDGVLSEELSQTRCGGGDGKVLACGSEALQSHGSHALGRVSDLLASLPEVDLFESKERNGMGCAKLAALNQLSFLDLACISYPGTGSSAAPAETDETLRVEVVFVTTGAVACSSPRLVVDCGSGRNLHVVESHLSLTADDRSLSNGVCRIMVAEGARVKHELLQQKASGARFVESVTSEVATGGDYQLRVIQNGARIGRTNAAIQLAGESAACNLTSTMIADSKQQLDLHSLIHHAVPSCKSQQAHKNVVADTAECIFKGTIQVDQIAQQTDSSQICRSLLLSEKASVKAMPVLQILADDVSCSHGATVTELDKDQVFYMASRGVSAVEARQLLLVAFPQDLLAGLKDTAPKAYARILDTLHMMAGAASSAKPAVA